MRQLPALVSSVRLPPEAATLTATEAGRHLAWVAADDETVWCAGQARGTRILRHVALGPDRPATAATALVRQALETDTATLILAPAAAAEQPWGFLAFQNGCRLAFPPGRPRLQAGPGLRPMLPGDESGLQRLYDRYASRLIGPGLWQEGLSPLVGRHPDETWMVFAQDGELTGALCAVFVRHPGRIQAQVQVLIDVTVEAFAGLMGYVGHLVDRGVEVRIEALPGDRPALALGDVVSKQRASLDRTMAARPGAPAAWLPALQYAAGAGEIVLGIDDPLGIWPSAVQLCWQDGRLRDWAATDSPAMATLSLPALMALATRQLGAEQLAFAGWLQGPASGYAQLENIWARHVLHRFVWERV
jgi:hypothetical protein